MIARIARGLGWTGAVASLLVAVGLWLLMPDNETSDYVGFATLMLGALTFAAGRAVRHARELVDLD